MTTRLTTEEHTMTDTTSTDTARTPWRDAAPWPGSPERDMGQSTLGPEGTRKALAEHYATMAHAHLDEFTVRILGRRRHCADCANVVQPHAGQYLRDLIRDHFEPGAAAFAAAALLNGKDAEWVVRVTEDAATMHEFAWSWLPSDVDPDSIAPASTPIPADVDPAS